MWLPLIGCLRSGLREDALVTLDILGLLERSLFRTREEHVSVLLGGLQPRVSMLCADRSDFFERVGWSSDGGDEGGVFRVTQRSL